MLMAMGPQNTLRASGIMARMAAKGETYYLINVRTTKRTLAHKGEELPIIPGMVADVDVRTGEKTVLGYLMKPLTRIQQSALRER